MKYLQRLSNLEKSSIVLAVVLLLCILPLPYGFYSIVRLATAIIAGCWAYKFFTIGKTNYAIITCSIVLLFQPLFKITLDKLTWNIIDVFISLLIGYFVLIKRYK